jgi:hypothetical protein
VSYFSSIFLTFRQNIEIYFYFFFVLKQRNKIQGEKPYPFFLPSKSLRSTTRKICISLLFAKPAAPLPMYALVYLTQSDSYRIHENIEEQF